MKKISKVKKPKTFLDNAKRFFKKLRKGTLRHKRNSLSFLHLFVVVFLMMLTATAAMANYSMTGAVRASGFMYDVTKPSIQSKNYIYDPQAPVLRGSEFTN